MLISIALLSSYRAVAEKREFVINGTIPSQQEGRVLVITDRLNGMDTLASGPLQNGKFQLKGELEKPIMACLMLEKFQGGFIFVLDTDAPYTMELHNNESSIITGGALQQTYLDYQEIVKNANLKIRDLKQQLAEAQKAQHFKTVATITGQLEQYMQQTKATLGEIISANRDNAFGVFIQTAGLENVNDIHILKSAYAQLSDKGKKLDQGQILAARIAEMEKIEVNAIAPDFTLQNPDGKALSMHSLQGKLKVIDFWASWCGPCRMENPNMVALYNDYKDKGLTVISVSLDEKKDAWVKAIEKDGMPWYHLSSLKGWNCETVKKYHIDGVPTIFVLDGANRVLAKNLRGEKLRQFVEHYLTTGK